MFIDREELESRLATDKNLVNATKSLQIERCGSGRTPGAVNRTDSQRAAIGELAHLVGEQNAADLTGASQSQVNSYKRGFNSSGKRHHNPALDNEIQDSLGKVRDAAIDRMLASMGLITDDKLKSVSKATDLATIAGTLSKVAQIGIPKESRDANSGPNVQVVVYAPAIKEEKTYEMVEVNAGS